MKVTEGYQEWELKSIDILCQGGVLGWSSHQRAWARPSDMHSQPYELIACYIQYGVVCYS